MVDRSFLTNNKKMKKKTTVRHSPRHLLDMFGTNCNGRSVNSKLLEVPRLDVPVTYFDPTSTNLKFQSEQQFKMNEVGSFISPAHCILCIGTAVLIDSVNLITKMEKREVSLKSGFY